MAEDAAEDVEEEAEKVEEDMAEEVLGDAEAHIKVRLTYHMSPVTLKIHIGKHSQTRQKKG